MMQRRLAAERAEANEGSNSSGSYNTLSPAQQAALHAWVGHAIRPGTGRTSAGRMSSYGLKHCFERSPGGFYLTNGAFKGAMLAAGYEPRDSTALNWQFRIEPRCPRRRRQQFLGRGTYPYIIDWEGRAEDKAAA